MRCHCCDKALSEAEIIPLPAGHGYEPCSVCLEIALDAAYSNGFTREDEEEDLYEDGAVETLDSDLFVSDFESDDWAFVDEEYD